MREGAEMSIHTHHAHTHTLQSCFADTIVTSTPFLPLPGRWGNADFPHALATAPVASLISPCLSPSLTRHCRHLEWGIAPNKTVDNCRPATQRKDKMGSESCPPTVCFSLSLVKVTLNLARRLPHRDWRLRSRRSDKWSLKGVTPVVRLCQGGGNQ